VQSRRTRLAIGVTALALGGLSALALSAQPGPLPLPGGLKTRMEVRTEVVGQLVLERRKLRSQARTRATARAVAPVAFAYESAGGAPRRLSETPQRKARPIAHARARLVRSGTRPAGERLNRAASGDAAPPAASQPAASVPAPASTPTPAPKPTEPAESKSAEPKPAEPAEPIPEAPSPAESSRTGDQRWTRDGYKPRVGRKPVG